jgi:hypothetical protein
MFCLGSWAIVVANRKLPLRLGNNQIETKNRAIYLEKNAVVCCLQHCTFVGTQLVNAQRYLADRKDNRLQRIAS